MYTTDHGDYMGEHGLFGKNCMYEAAYRIPLLVRWPDGVPAGTVVDDMMSTVDFQQTMLGLMDLPSSGREQGQDLAPLLIGHSTDLPQEVHAHNQGFVRASLFTPQWNLGLVPQGRCMLFDRFTDPLEQRNLYGNPAYNDVVVELTEHVVQHHEQVKSPAWMWLRILASAQRDLIKQGLPINVHCER